MLCVCRNCNVLRDFQSNVFFSLIIIMHTSGSSPPVLSFIYLSLAVQVTSLYSDNYTQAISQELYYYTCVCGGITGGQFLSIEYCFL